MFTFTKNVHAMFLSSFMLMYKKKLKLKKSQNIRRYFCFSSITDRQISPALIILKLFFGKTIRENWKFYEFLVRGIKKLIHE